MPRKNHQKPEENEKLLYLVGILAAVFICTTWISCDSSEDVRSERFDISVACTGSGRNFHCSYEITGLNDKERVDYALLKITGLSYGDVGLVKSSKVQFKFEGQAKGECDVVLPDNIVELSINASGKIYDLDASEEQACYVDRTRNFGLK